MRDNGEIIKSLAESNNNLVVNQQITVLAIKELQKIMAKIENTIKDKGGLDVSTSSQHDK